MMYYLHTIAKTPVSLPQNREFIEYVNINIRDALSIGLSYKGKEREENMSILNIH